MVFGGVPYYLDQIDHSLSAALNIHNLCFRPNGVFQDEFQDLYHSLFQKAENPLTIIEALGQKRKGLTIQEPLKITRLPNAGSTTKILKELKESGFVEEYLPYGGGKYNIMYQLKDFFSLFYLHFIKNKADNNWLAGIDSPQQRVWSGYALEMFA